MIIEITLNPLLPIEIDPVKIDFLTCETLLGWIGALGGISIVIGAAFPVVFHRGGFTVNAANVGNGNRLHPCSLSIAVTVNTACASFCAS